MKDQDWFKEKFCLSEIILRQILVILFIFSLFVSNHFILGQDWTAGNNNDRPMNTIESVRRAIDDMIYQFGDDYPNGEQYLEELAELEKSADFNNPEWTQNFDAFRRKALLENPLLDEMNILVIRSPRIPGPGDNFMTIDVVPKEGWDCEIDILSNIRNDDPTLTTIYKPANNRPILEPELHWDAKRLMFSSVSEENKRWAIFEINLDGSGLKTLTPTDQPDVDFFDSCYAPDGSIISCSNAGKQGLPCINGGAPMANIYKIDPKTKQVRQLTFEQDSDWHPTPLSNGRIMYLRWEYSDIMHYFSRILFHMNPDGTNQAELYGSGSFFPTAFKHAREFPDSSKIVGIGGGHHGRGDTGRLLIIDPTVGRKYPFRYHPTSREWGPELAQIDVHPEIFPFEKTGFFQEIPGFGRDVVGNVLDMQSTGLKYNFLFPYPLGENYILVNCQIEGDPNTYGLYLVDIFDNMTLIKKIDNQGLFVPIPIVERDLPPVLPDRHIPGAKTATAFITDVYNGEGTKNIPRGTIKAFKIFAYHFAYLNSGGHESVGVQSSWDIKRLLGTVPVDEDGSAFFTIPANTPIALLPVDENGAALQLFRSWFVGMPGENVSCNGCHESQLDVTPSVKTTASQRQPNEIEDYLGPKRPITFELDIYYRVVKKYCFACHDGSKTDRPSFADAQTAYDNIHPFVRRPGPETDMDVLPPYEYHISTSELWQMFEKNHYNVQLDDEAKRLLINWVDFNAPWRGKWDKPGESQRRLELSQLYANVADDIENEYDRLLNEMRNQPAPDVIVPPEFIPPTDELGNDWAFDEATAKELQKQAAQNGSPTKSIELADGVSIDFVLIPAGEFVMGSLDGFPNENPRTLVKIEKPFWMSATEITNEQFGVFDPNHDTRYIEEHGKDHIVPGYIANHPKQPVARVSWNEVCDFIQWFSQEKNVNAQLPTESQWEWAARAGSSEKFYFGSIDADFSKFANLADADRRFLYTTWENGATVHQRRPYPKNSVFPLRDDRFKDNWFVVDYVAQVQANAWGLYDMIGNVAEWTRSNYRPYPYNENDGRNDISSTERKTIRGGSWADRPKVSGSATRFGYQPWQKVHNVGFRVVIEND
ncbi:MAG: SUMF1/EgtB/PvdO family nonheme iron enzyme [Planctomycetia bacterium]|nr:SUMF1/EgtB/PvdO family nonheme iron enzyme [Planctomycetia bacterium]